jgi:hypothetical protein
MTMAPGMRKVALVAHVGCSVSWIGAIATSFVLGVAGIASPDGQVVRAAYITLDLIGWYALIPLSLASLITGLIQSLGTTWGLLRHYWVIAKLLMNLFATGVLLLYTQTIAYLTNLARTADTTAELDQLRNPSPILHAVGAMVLLLVALVLSIYKPRGLTAYGRRTLQRQRAATAATRAKQAISQH